MSDNPILDLAVEISEGNPGALSVLRDLQWFTKWPEMVRWLAKNDYRGPKIWIRYKDELHMDIHAFGEWIQEELDKERAQSPRTEHGPIFPKFS